ncbi:MULTISPECIES: LysR substrate-binding domain-containing protein [Pseudomonadaceae]|uniref:LysR substrate-binding domain-containing protein n=1 Tax=Pseudomonadaceae TaxID=135621 RepID=UPI0005CA98F8|nr:MULTISPECIES: LysR substrate-binding domain-containing protein [Pseudomonas]KIV60562.1 Glycine cleavage system transcriptional activator [Pseudomonas sp. FeS53a]MCO7553646.1 LysR substrate-binding domain-containing protein [Pseudomonas otitidis]MDH0335841.1 LysR substrate-binding domain-containing protein [Pseudomonas otitidis]MDH1107752.1 LysR substrate-binding domain-containing protein [Pseudomonas otitidis]MDH1159160.1 LysR substrate-binding domain-containing protein [Pseudomonas otitidi
MRRLPSLTALRTFEAAARHAHFGRAAQELCVTDSAVSHQIRQLEEQLGVTLFEREGRQVRPSAPARRLLHSLQQAFELILDACDELRDPGSQAQLRVAVTTELAQKWLVGRLADFAERHPQITLHLHEQPLEAQLPGAEMDLAIIYGTGPEDASGYFVRPLPTLQFFPVCSPGLFNQSPLKHPRDLARHCLLHDDQDGKTWNAWLATHAADLRPARHLYLGHAGLTMEAAARGQGVAIGDNLTSAEDLASGRLVRPFAAQVPSLGQYALVCERLRLDKPAVAQFVDWFSDQLADM